MHNLTKAKCCIDCLNLKPDTESWLPPQWTCVDDEGDTLFFTTRDKPEFYLFNPLKYACPEWANSQPPAPEDDNGDN